MKGTLKKRKETPALGRSHRKWACLVYSWGLVLDKQTYDNIFKWNVSETCKLLGIVVELLENLE